MTQVVSGISPQVSFGAAKLSELRRALQEADPVKGISIQDSEAIEVSKRNPKYRNDFIASFKTDGYIKQWKPLKYDIQHIFEVPNDPGVNGAPLFIFVRPDHFSLGSFAISVRRPQFLPGENARQNSGDYVFPNFDIIG